MKHNGERCGAVSSEPVIIAPGSALQRGRGAASGSETGFEKAARRRAGTKARFSAKRGRGRCKKSVLSHRSVRLKELTKDRACGPLTLLLHTGIARDSDLPIPPGGVSHVNKRRSSLQAASKNASGKWQGEKS